MSLKVLRAAIDITVLSSVMLVTYHATASLLLAIFAGVLVAGYGLWCFIDGASA